MLRRLSGSAEETDNNNKSSNSSNPIVPESQFPGHGDKKSFTSSKYDVKRELEALDRRKIEKAPAPTQSIPDGPRTHTGNTQGAPRKPVPPSQEQDVDRMPEPRGWRRSQARSPWSCSLLTLTATAVAIVLLLSIIHAFVTRQLDPKGCDMCWSRPIYIKFSDFDTEHTRFASKYSLYLHREGGFDEDPKVSPSKAMRAQ